MCELAHIIETWHKTGKKGVETVIWVYTSRCKFIGDTTLHHVHYLTHSPQEIVKDNQSLHDLQGLALKIGKTSQILHVGFN